MAKIVSFGKLLNRVVENASAADKEEKFTPDKWRIAPWPPKKRPATDSDRKHNSARYQLPKRPAADKEEKYPTYPVDGVFIPVDQ